MDRRTFFGRMLGGFVAALVAKPQSMYRRWFDAGEIARLDGELTRIATAYQPVGYIADQVLPPGIHVTNALMYRREQRIAELVKADFRREAQPDVRRGPNAEAAGSSPAASTNE